MQPTTTMDGTVTATISVSMPEDTYLHRLRALAAWWSLGSSALEPRVLMGYVPVPLSDIREAGL